MNEKYFTFKGSDYNFFMKQMDFNLPIFYLIQDSNINRV